MMLFSDGWGIVVFVTNILFFFTWCFPLASLSILSYAIQYYTNFRTRWKLMVTAMILTLSYPLAVTYSYAMEARPISHLILFSTSLLLSGLTMSAYASTQLLSFQKIDLGKTKNTIKALILVSVFLPLMIFLSVGANYLMALQLIGYNLSVTALILIFLAIGKLTYNYVPRYRLLAYSSARLGSVLLVIDPLLQNWMLFSDIEPTFAYGLRLVGALMMLLASGLLMIPVIMLILEAQARGLHLLPTREEKDNKPMKYRLEKGFSYLLREASSDRAFMIFTEFVTHNHNGLMLTRTQPSRLRHRWGLNTTPVLWMTNARTDEKSVKPTDLERIKCIVRDFIMFDTESIILFERLDYIITENDFNKILKFIHSLNDIVTGSKSILLLSLNPQTVSGEQMALLLEELEDLTNADKISLGEPLYSVLLFVHSENNRKKMPSFKNITNKFEITKTTARKRIYELESRGLLRILSQGRYKFLEVTERGRSIVGTPFRMVDGGENER